ncbi:GLYCOSYLTRANSFERASE [Salix purpurea]|uniref:GLYCOSYLTRANSFERASE n=1 Tax=Salix purpurea TaxID=77065 RepID=A0A9Q0V4I6_SALPP|nr:GLYCOSYLTRANSFERASE [Salix purpurea]
MAKSPPELSRPTNPTLKKPSDHKQRTTMSVSSLYSPKLSVFLLALCVSLFTLYHIQSLHAPPSSPPWSTMNYWERVTNCTQELKPTVEKLRQAVTFLPLKDLRYADKALQGHTWFMSSMNDTHEEGEVQYQQFPSEPSKGRLLCFKGKDTRDGSWNSYALAWPEALPINAKLLKGLTFVSYNHYDYGNIWHGLSATASFVAWHIRNGCESPNRWILYHWGELRFTMALWLRILAEATYGGAPYIERFEGIDDGQPVCFEKAVVMRHNEGGMSRNRRVETYDLMRCRARMFCNVSLEGRIAEVNKQGLPVIGMTLLLRTGARSFKNESAVIGILEKECAKIDGCRLMVAYSSNLTFCEQVKLMSLTDILATPHGAQLTNLFLMDRNSSIMEFFPKGWLELAGVGQYVFHWLASWSGMRHQGTWRDPDGDECPYGEDGRRCMSLYKNGKIGFNETELTEWTKKVLNEEKLKKLEEAAANKIDASTSVCACG